MTLAEILGLVAAALSVVATAAAAGAAIASSGAAKRANETAERMTRLEEARRLAELTPIFDVKLKRLASSGFAIFFTLTGPPELLLLDAVAIRIRNDGLDWAPRAPEGERSSLATFAWGPAQFREGIDGSVSRVESKVFENVEQGTELLVSVEPSTAPRWFDQAEWVERYRNHPLRLAITCHRGSDSWTVHLNVATGGLYRGPGIVV